MPSIAQAKLDQIEQDRDVALALAKRHTEERLQTKAKLDAAQAALASILQAAHGQAITDPNDRSNQWGIASNTSLTGNFAHVEPTLSDAERERLDREQEKQHLLGLERRLAAVVAVAQYAKAHLR